MCLKVLKKIATRKISPHDGTLEIPQAVSFEASVEVDEPWKPLPCSTAAISTSVIPVGMAN